MALQITRYTNKEYEVKPVGTSGPSQTVVMQIKSTRSNKESALVAGQGRAAESS